MCWSKKNVIPNDNLDLTTIQNINVLIERHKKRLSNEDTPPKCVNTSPDSKYKDFEIKINDINIYNVAKHKYRHSKNDNN